MEGRFFLCLSVLFVVLCALLRLCACAYLPRWSVNRGSWFWLEGIRHIHDETAIKEGLIVAFGLPCCELSMPIIAT